MGHEDIKFPKGARFLVTGAAGFIGSNLVEALLKSGYQVRGLDNFSTGKRENVDLFLNNPNYEFIEGDIRDLNMCIKVCASIDYVLHQAAWGSVPRSIEMPLLYEEINIRGTLNMMEAARQNNVKKFVYASSSSVYGDEPNLPKKEGMEGNLLSPYALTKKVDEEYGKIYSKLYGLDTYGMRYFNVFGRRQDPNGDYAAVIPKFIKQLLNEERPTINGDGKQSRDFTYIENVIEANLRACKATHEVAGQVFNIAYGGRECLIDVYYYLCGVLEKDIEPKFGPERAGDIRHSNADISKARELLGYDPNWSFERGITEAIEWYKGNLQGEKMGEELIRVLHIVGIMNRGGIETFLMNIYRKIDRTKMQFDFLITREETGAFDKEIISLGGKIYNIPHIKKIGPTKYKKTIEQFFREHSEYKIVHCHMNAWSGLFLPIAKKCEIPVKIAHSHTAISMHRNKSIVKFIELMFMNVMKYRIRYSANYFFSCSYDAGIWLFGKEIANKNMNIINNGIDTEKFIYNCEIAKKVRESLEIPLDSLVVGHVGNMREVKNHRFLIDIFESLHNNVSNSYLCLVGDGKLRQKLEEQIRAKSLEHNVRILGSRSDVYDLLKAFDVFVMPSLFEGFSMVLVEAQAASLTCIASNAIPKEVDMGMGLIDFVSLDESHETWAELILNKKNSNRNISIEKLIRNGYDIQTTVDRLTSFYIDRYNSG